MTPTDHTPIINSILTRAQQEIEQQTGLNLIVQIAPPTLLQTQQDSLQHLVEQCCQLWGVTTQYLKEKNRNHHRSNLRALLCYIIKEKWPSTYLRTIGEIFDFGHDAVIDCIERTKTFFAFSIF